jgi:hypothetical protein
MTAKTVACTIERRLLVNYRIEPELVARLLPWPFRPQLVSGLAVGGVCFIRLGGLRAGHLPRVPRLVSENAAHPGRRAPAERQLGRAAHESRNPLPPFRRYGALPAGDLLA